MFKCFLGIFVIRVFCAADCRQFKRPSGRALVNKDSIRFADFADTVNERMAGNRRRRSHETWVQSQTQTRTPNNSTTKPRVNRAPNVTMSWVCLKSPTVSDADASTACSFLSHPSAHTCSTPRSSAPGR